MDGRDLLSRHLSNWVADVSARPWLTLSLCATLTLGSLAYAAAFLGVDTDTIELFPEDLPARKNHQAFSALFPDLENALLIVIDAQTPEAARSASDALLAALDADSENFEDAYVPGGGSFFERHALVYRSVDELDRFADNLARVQPIVAALERDPSIANLALLIQRGLDQIGREGGDSELWSELLDRVGQASVEVYREHPVAVSWEALMVRGSAIEVQRRLVIVAHPVLDFEAALPGAKPLAAIRSAVADLPVEIARVRVRITGNPALTHEETLSLLWDIGVSSLFCLVLVSGILWIALRSLPLVVGVVVTLLCGLTCTAAFAAVAVGNLNVISVAAGVLFLGLGVDFGIHLAMRYADLLCGGAARKTALDQATRGVGPSLVLCSLTTAIGFFAFLPTDYRGVAELGLITGVGLFIMLFMMLTLFPALLTTLLQVDPSALGRRSLRFGEGPARFVERHHRTVLWASLLAACLSLVLIPELRFEPNIVAMRDDSTESVQTFNDLLEDAGISSPWYANSVTQSLEEANRVRAAMRELPAVESAITLSDYVPEEQEEKLEILDDLAMMLETPTRVGGAAKPKLSAGEQVEALRRLEEALRRASEGSSFSPIKESVGELQQQLGVFLRRAERERDPQVSLGQLEHLLLSSLPEQIARLRRSLTPDPIDLESLPARLVARLQASGGEARVQIFPRENLEDHEAFQRFVDSVQRVDPQVTGVAVNLVEFARTTQEAFRQALLTAVLVIAAILWILWQRPRDVLLVLVPLTLAALLTAATMVLIGLPLSFFNVVVIPLLLGAGVDTGIHLMEQARRGASDPNHEHVLQTTTARAVLFSALTTITSFGTLAFSSHAGVSGLGVLLSVGMALTVVANLVVLPALLTLRVPARREARRSLLID